MVSARENHILYAAGVLRDVVYKDDLISYLASETHGVEYLHLNFRPENITIEGKQLRSGEVAKTRDIN